VDAETVNKLLETNRAFYSQFSDDFSESRSSERFNIEPFREHLRDGIRLLDAGCGNGRFANTLQDAGYMLEYVGIDGSAELIAHAQKRAPSLSGGHAEFRVVDLTVPNWGESLADVAPFDVVVSLAVLHHIPAFEGRTQVLREFRTLLKPHGTLVLSNWQFTHSERLRKKIVGWHTIGLDESQIEHNDYLLDWKRGGTGYRYVHLIDQSEIQQLAEASGFRVMKQFYADADLNLLSILTPSR
jgi:tRNA (uracil-5-)-methyltransferase TRM9